MNDLSLRAAQALWRLRFALAGIALVATLIAFQGLASLGVSNSLDVWYPEDDPELLNYQAFQETYGSDEIIVVAVSGAVDFATQEGTDVVAELTDRLLDLDGVATVTSLVTVPESLAAARGRLLSADGRTTALVVQTLIGPQIEARRHQLFLDIRSEVGALGLAAHLGGYGVVFDGLNEASTTGAASLIASAHIVMVILLTLLFRRLLPVLLTLLAVGVATTWTMSLYAVTGHQLNMVTMVLPTLVLVIGIADCLHVLRSVAAQDPALDRQAQVTRGIAAIIGPCFLMSVTTAAGFLGLTASGLPVVQQLGWFGAVGMLAAFVAAMTLLPAGLTWRRFEPVRSASTLDRAAVRLFDLGAARPRLTVAAFGVLMAISIFGVFQLNSDTDSIGYMRKSHVVRQDSDFIEAEIGPYVPIEFTVTAPGNILEDDYLDAIWAWQRSATELPEIGWSWSLLSALSVDASAMPSAIGEDNLRVALTRMRRFSPVTAGAMIAGDNELRVSFGAPIMSARSVSALIDRIVAEATLPEDLVIRPAGYSPLYTRIVDEIVTSQVNGFAAAIVLI
ncbi:MAG TPA: MMPL family transporter, partial [Xanthomonadales bacterium]|nr:MMPL family transporter [Xanthomonadales bacterium]